MKVFLKGSILVSIALLYSCASSVVEYSVSDVVPVGQFPFTPEWRVPDVSGGFNAQLEGIWLTYRSRGDVEVWSRMEIDDAGHVVTHQWTNAERLGHYEAQLTEITPSLYLMTIDKITRENRSAFAYLDDGIQRICKIQYESAAGKIPKILRHCVKKEKDVEIEDLDIPEGAEYWYQHLGKKTAI